AGQLRDCYSLFRGHDGTNRGIYADYPYSGNGVLSQLAGLETIGDRLPSNLASDQARRVDPATANIAPADTYWSQLRIGGKDATALPSSENSMLNAFEFASVLGAGQQCPLNSGAWSANTFNGQCVKPSNPKHDFRGDIFGALAYLARENADPVYTASGSAPTSFTQTFPAIRQPGLFFLRPNLDLSDDTIDRLTPFVSGAGSEYQLLPSSVFGSSPLSVNDADKEAGEQIVIIVTHNAPRLNEVALWRRYLTGAWREKSASGCTPRPCQEPDVSAIDSGVPRWASLYPEHIIVVQIPFSDDDDLSADISAFGWMSALMGHNVTEGEGSFFSRRRQVMYLGPYGFQRFGYANAEKSTYEAECGLAARVSGKIGPVESCLYGKEYSSDPETAYGNYWEDLLRENPATSGRPEEWFGGNIRERARQIYDFITSRVTLL
ncbi:MAG: hypothetical protein KDD60_08295, partial [Bdellovibrionales bacterium]|nr:hypothetical protein [Bdellovibrionales bacterium]